MDIDKSAYSTVYSESSYHLFWDCPYSHISRSKLGIFHNSNLSLTDMLQQVKVNLSKAFSMKIIVLGYCHTGYMAVMWGLQYSQCPHNEDCRAAAVSSSQD